MRSRALAVVTIVSRYAKSQRPGLTGEPVVRSAYSLARVSSVPYSTNRRRVPGFPQALRYNQPFVELLVGRMR